MRKLLLIAITLPLIANAATPAKTNSLHISPLSQISMPANFKADIAKREDEEKSKGYHEEDSSTARFLLNLKHTATNEIKQYQATTDLMDTHLRGHLDNIHLVFPFSNNWVDAKKIIGYAPLGSFVKLDETEGWTGIKIFFNDSHFGTCAYSYFNLNASGGSVLLSKEYTEYLVNKKPSSKDIEGSNNSGFVYSVNWYEEGAMHILECASNKYDSLIFVTLPANTGPSSH